MNQILATEKTAKNKNSRTLEIKTILIIFSVCFIVFGGLIASKATYAILNKQDENSTSIPLVNVIQNGSKLNINITHNKLIDKMAYSWNGENEITLQGKGRMVIEETIDIPVGTNTLLLKVTDIDGQTVTYNQEYTLENGDVTNPEIELVVENSKVKIIAKDETALDNISFYWNNEDKTDIQANEGNPKEIDERIDILKGENTLTVVAVDKAGNQTTKTQTYKGAKKPTIELSIADGLLNIKVADEEEIKKVEYTINDTYYSTDPNNTGTSLGMKTLEIKQKVSAGDIVKVTAYNVNDLSYEVAGSVPQQ